MKKFFCTYCFLIFVVAIAGCENGSDFFKSDMNVSIKGVELFLYHNRWGISGGGEAILITNKEEVDYKYFSKYKDLSIIRFVAFSDHIYYKVVDDVVHVYVHDYAIPSWQSGSADVKGLKVIRLDRSVDLASLIRFPAN